MSLVNKILKEASFEGDVKTVALIKQYFNKAVEIIKKFDGKDTNYMKVDPYKKYIVVNMGKIRIAFYSHDTTDINARVAASNGTHGQYIPDANIVHVYNCEFEIEKGKIAIQDLHLDTAFHEIVHAMDKARTKGKNAMVKAADKVSHAKDDDAKFKNYANSEYEFNAFFIETIMPLVEKYLVNGQIFQSTFDEFKDKVIAVYNSKGGRSFLMDEKMKKKFLKRIYQIYHGFKKGIKVNLEVSDESLEKLDMDKVSRKMKSTVLSKVLNALGMF